MTLSASKLRSPGMLLRSVVGGASRRAQKTVSEVARLPIRRLGRSPTIAPKNLPMPDLNKTRQ
jgi:hypothetical protein